MAGCRVQLRVVCSLVAGTLAWFASSASAQLSVVRQIDPDDAPGAPFSPGADIRLELRRGEAPTLAWGREGAAHVDPRNTTFVREPGGTTCVLALDVRTGEVLELRPRRKKISVRRRRVFELAQVDARGLAYDPSSDRLFVLEGGSRLLRVDGFRTMGARTIEKLPLPPDLPRLRGLAYDPASGHLFALAPDTRELLELTPDGELISNQLLPKAVEAPQAIAITASLDPSDEPARTSLFVASEGGGGGGTSELALQPLAMAAAGSDAVTLLQTIHTSAFSPPSPDPSGVELLGPDGPLLVSDGEVEETVHDANVNLFEVSLSGALVGVSDATFFTNEPVGMARNSATGDFLVSQDDPPRGVFEVTPGADGRIHVGDPVRFIPTDPIGIVDPEGAAWGDGALFIADGVASEVWRIAPGPNGVLDGGGDDQITHFDTQSAGLSDPEGIAFDPDGGHLYVTGEPATRIGHFTVDGTLLRWIDIAVANARVPAGLAYGPAPAGAPGRRLYVVDRGVDNNQDPNENDGKLYVLSLSPLLGNLAPNVSAGPDRTIVLGQTASLDGTVSDDGGPGALSTSWSQVSGPGVASFANPNAVDTTASFSAGGIYVVRLTASDGELSLSDTATVVVNDPAGPQVLQRRIVTGTDDAEESPSGSVSLGGGDLELVTDGSSVQTVGLRFTDLALPPGATILEAWIQFWADEGHSDPTTLVLEAQAAAHAPPFLSSKYNLSLRPRTQASAVWIPAPWEMVGEALEKQRTPDLRALVQEVVNGGGWASGNAIAFLITGQGRRVAESFEASPLRAALLQVVYLNASGGNTAPVVTIAQPVHGSTFVPGASIPFSGSASDAEERNLSSSLVWTSSRDGQIGTGASFVSSNLSTGTHGITARATDSAGQSGEAQVSITIAAPPNAPPQVSIDAPASGQSFPAGASVQFTGSASDPEDGSLSSSLVWTSSLDGPIGTGASFTRSNLSSGTHGITASATDSNGASGSAQVTLTIETAANLPPTVQILAPASGSTFRQGESVRFTATAVDPEVGSIVSSLAWTSSLQGTIGSGPSFETSKLKRGTHVITARATDPSGQQGTDQITVRIRRGD